MKVACVLFAKPPIAGFVKTRLALNLGEPTTLRLYRLMLEWQWENLRNLMEVSQKRLENETRVQLKPFVFLAQPLDMKLKAAVHHFSFLPPVKGIRFQAQSSGDLGERLSNAFRTLKSRFDFMIVWGSDIPSLVHYDIEKALSHRTSACLLPASDGGYCLIGIHSKLFDENLFQKIAWGTKNTFLTQKKRFNDLNLPVNIMHTMPDLDNPRDIIRNILYMKKQDDPIYKKRIDALNSFWERETRLLKKNKI